MNYLLAVAIVVLTTTFVVRCESDEAEKECCEIMQEYMGKTVCGEDPDIKSESRSCVAEKMDEDVSKTALEIIGFEEWNDEAWDDMCANDRLAEVKQKLEEDGIKFKPCKCLKKMKDCIGYEEEE